MKDKFLGTEELIQNFEEIQKLVSEIDSLVSRYAVLFEQKINAKNISDKSLNKDEHKIVELGVSFQKIKMYFGKIYDQHRLFDSKEINKLSKDEKLELDDVTQNAVNLQKTLLGVLSELKNKLSECSYITEKHSDWTTDDVEKFTIKILEAYQILDIFLKNSASLVELSDSITRKANALVNRIVAEIKILPLREKKAGDKGELIYHFGIPKKELIYLQYLTAMNTLDCGLTHRNRSNIMYALHSDDTLNFDHYNLLLSDESKETNIHIIPLESAEGFEEFKRKFSKIAA